MQARYHGPLHPLLVHFPVAALTLLPVLDGLILLGWNTVQGVSLASLAELTLITGLVSALPTMVAGIRDSLLLTTDDSDVQLLQRHVMWILISLCVFFIALLVRKDLLGIAPALVAPSLDVAGFVLLCVGAHQGGQLAHSHWPDFKKN